MRHCHAVSPDFVDHRKGRRVTSESRRVPVARKRPQEPAEVHAKPSYVLSRDDKLAALTPYLGRFATIATSGDDFRFYQAMETMKTLTAPWCPPDEPVEGVQGSDGVEINFTDFLPSTSGNS